MVHGFCHFGRHVRVDRLLLVLVVEVQEPHVVVRATDEDIDLDRHQLLHDDEVGEVRDSLQVHLSDVLARLLVGGHDLTGNSIVDDSESLIVEALLTGIERVNHSLVGL